MTFKIEQGVPHPAHQSIKYPFAEMSVGDSFLINGDASHQKVATAAQKYGLAQGRNWKFSVRKTPDGYRCWRTQ